METKESEPCIAFMLPDPSSTPDNPMRVEIIKITKDGFFYKGEKVEDVHNVYDRFNKLLSEAEALPKNAN